MSVKELSRQVSRALNSVEYGNGLPSKRLIERLRTCDDDAVLSASLRTAWNWMSANHDAVNPAAQTQIEAAQRKMLANNY